MIAALQRRKLNMYKWREGMLSPRALVRGIPARVKFAAENMLLCVEDAYVYACAMLGLKRYAQPTIRYDTRYDAHDMIRSAIHLPFLPGKQRLVIPACDQKHCTPPTTTACAVMMRSGYNNGGLLGVSRCSVYVMNTS